MSDSADIFTDLNWDDVSDNPFGLDPGVHETTISEAKIDKSSKGNLGLWVTFTSDNKRSIRKWLSMPETGQDSETFDRNLSYLKFFLSKQLQIPKSELNNVMNNPSELIGTEVTLTVAPQNGSDEYMAIKKIVLTKSYATHGTVSPDFSKPTAPANPGGFDF